MEETGQVSESGSSMVKHALNPDKAFMQVHYLKVRQMWERQEGKEEKWMEIASKEGRKEGKRKQRAIEQQIKLFVTVVVLGTALVMTIAVAAVLLCVAFDESCFVVFICLVLCPGLLPPQVLGQSSGRATIHRLLPIICEEIPRATHLVSGEAEA